MHCKSFPRRSFEAKFEEINRCSWNVEGFTYTKLEELQNHINMFHNHIGVLCLEETHRTVSQYYITDGGCLLILSGEEDGCFAGVGFIVAPHCRRCVVSLCRDSCRQASLKLRVPGGKMVICSLYAPHSGKPFDERQTFFQAAAEWMNSLSRHGPLLALGDFNARVHKMHAGDSDWPTHFWQQECIFQCRIQ